MSIEDSGNGPVMSPQWVRHIKDNVYLTIARDVIQPFVLFALTAFVGWMVQDHLDVRERVIILEANSRANEAVHGLLSDRIGTLESLSLANASNRFTDIDADRLENRVETRFDQLDSRIDRLEDRIGE